MAERKSTISTTRRSTVRRKFSAVVRAQTKVDKLRVKMMKKVLQYLKTAMGEWTDDHHDHFEQMALVCHEIRR